MAGKKKNGTSQTSNSNFIYRSMTKDLFFLFDQNDFFKIYFIIPWLVGWLDESVGLFTLMPFMKQLEYLSTEHRRNVKSVFKVKKGLLRTTDF